MKNFLILALGAGAVYFLYKAYEKGLFEMPQKNEPIQPPETKAEITCPEGEILCPDKQICYNPSAKYIVDPCI